MAMYVPGVPCGLCGRPVRSDEDHVLFPPFTGNRRDPLYVFSDGVFHRSCVVSDPRGGQAERVAAITVQARPSSQRCAVCGESFAGPETYFTTAYLGAAEHGWNFLCLHPTCFTHWTRAGAFRKRVEQMQRGDLWDGPRIVFEPSLAWTMEIERDG